MVCRGGKTQVQDETQLLLGAAEKVQQHDALAKENWGFKCSCGKQLTNKDFKISCPPRAGCGMKSLIASSRDPEERRVLEMVEENAIALCPGCCKTYHRCPGELVPNSRCRGNLGKPCQQFAFSLSKPAKPTYTSVFDHIMLYHDKTKQPQQQDEQTINVAPKDDSGAHSQKRQKVEPAPEEPSRPLPAGAVGSGGELVGGGGEVPPRGRALERFGLTPEKYAGLPAGAKRWLVNTDERCEKMVGLCAELLDARERREMVRRKYAAAVNELKGALDVASMFEMDAERAVEKARDEYCEAENLYFDCGGVKLILD